MTKREPIFSYLIIAVLLHAILLAVFMINLLREPAKTYIDKPNHAVIKAHAVSSQQLQQEMRQIKREEEQKRQRALAAKRKAEAARQAKLRAAKQAVAKRKAAAAARKKALAAKRKAEQVAKQQAIAAKQQAEAQKKLIALRREQALTAAKQKQKDLEKKLWQQQMAHDQAQLKAARAQQVQGIVDKYRALVIQAIAQKWIIPDNVNPMLTSLLRIQLAPGGTVINVNLVRSSGNSVLDRSAITAVYAASPLPVPQDSDAFAAFREFELNVRPEDVR